MLYLNDAPLRFIKFPSGETHFRSEEFLPSFMEVTLKFESNDDIINLMLFDDFCVRTERTYSLKCSYIPSSRQDRVQTEEAFSLQVYTKILNDLKAREYLTYTDPHSEVTTALLNEHASEKPLVLPSYLKDIIEKESSVFVSPDLGAVKRTNKLAEGKPVLLVNKVRDYVTGEIISTELLNANKISSNSFVVVDDICDGGRTFIELAKVLKETYSEDINLHLYVTHGFFTKGLEVLSKAGYKTIGCFNDMQKVKGE